MIKTALDIVALGLFGKDHGLAEVLSADSCQSNAAGLGREDHGDLIHVKIPAEFLGYVDH
ncbi:hypothetical protein SDC9_121234 [bioreactor metagenome]|uniref:Uncharacterized protein n=1 Tax=bioreactor metagenome TaxID=1076179 RepID=A0A645CBE4_9ZZZZ